MPIDASKILNRIRGNEGKRGPVTLYLNRELLEAFKQTCQEMTPSKVLEELMREFIDSARNSPVNLTYEPLKVASTPKPYEPKPKKKT